MKFASACLLSVLASAGTLATAQGAGDPSGEAQACSNLEEADKGKCPDLPPRDIAQEPSRSRTALGSDGTTALDSWIFSETTSPIDYSPVIVASATARGPMDGSGIKLSIACRSGNTSVALIAPGPLPSGDRNTVTYAVDGSSPTTLAAGILPSGTSVAFGADAVSWLASLPARGEIAFRIVGRQGGVLEGRYSLAALKATLERMTVPCKWPIKRDTARKR